MSAVTSNNQQAILLEWANNTGDEFSRDIAGNMLQDSKDVKSTHDFFGNDESLYKDEEMLDETKYIAVDKNTYRHNNPQIRKEN